MEFIPPTWAIPGAEIVFLGCELLGTTLRNQLFAEHGACCNYEVAGLGSIFGLHSSACCADVFNSMSLMHGFAWIQASASAKKMTFTEC